MGRSLRQQSSAGKDIDLHRVLHSRSELWVEPALAMIVGRVIYQGSKLSLCNQSPNTCLWELCGIKGRPDVEEHCYATLDRLLERQPAIQKELAAKHLVNGTLVLYDITSTYFEGEHADSRIVDFGYNRGRKKGYKQVVIGLLCNAQGCPVGCEVFKGNTNDATTVAAKIDELRETYDLKKIIFVGDRGMLTAARRRDLAGIQGLAKIADHKQTTTVEILAARIGRLLAKHKMGKFIIWEVQADGAKKITRPPSEINRVRLPGIEFDQTTEADEEQKEILTLLKTSETAA